MCRSDNAVTQTRRHTIVPLQTSGTRPLVFWIPGGAGVAALSLRHMVAALGPDQPALALCTSFPEHLDDVEPVEDRAKNYLPLIRSVQPHGPYYLAGFCAGGLVAFE